MFMCARVSVFVRVFLCMCVCACVRLIIIILSLRSLIDYLRKFYYYDPEEEMYLSIKEARRGMGAEPGVESQT